MKRQYLVVQEPQPHWRRSHVVIVVPMLGESKADVIRQFTALHASKDKYFKKPQAHVLMNGNTYHF